MHQLMPLKWKLTLVILLAAIIGHVASSVGFGHLTIGAVIGAVEVVVIFLAGKTWGLLWWVPGLPLWAKVDLTGRWAGAIESQWAQDAPDSKPPPIPVHLDLRQGWQEIVFSLATERMRSRSSGALPGLTR